ncbi:sigma-54-dependent transcriptional regulator [Alkaliphilus peptidifermentans]|uniref:Stage 0 sporulation protein A homolog n=1 Tax=Alkaliphilus peptidifermentans DSM 18978 TaxID=1120976 RepID=A0A1G5AF54_9FIRM|nr:sigma-54 dependent transcriptional regulator [Alkaliphilus peptidifermentans]SCX76495.1 two-component system, NtrC family, response regulator AtoC [Alkaliphilus peptidifermentans DSM 18978]
MNKVLIIDDESAICNSLEFALEDHYEIYAVQDVAMGMGILDDTAIDIVLLDLKIGNISGLEVLKKIKSIKEDTQVIMMTAYGNIESSVEAIKEGAFHYLTKPLNTEELIIYIEKALKYKRMSNSLTNLRQVIDKEYSIQGIVGNSAALKHILTKIEKVKDIDTTILITGESGTGKDMIAKAIHFQGKRRNEPLEIVNCAAIPSNLLESELFGYEKGAFTGADKKKLGKIELAHKGTLFLDEIGDMDLQLQAKILRIVEDMQVTPLGSEKSKKVDVRIVAATNKDLLQEVKNNKFREDLYYRLNVISIKMPSLKERREDIPVLLKWFINKYNVKLKKSIEGFTPEALKALENYEYPGNIRELENFAERAVALADQRLISIDDLPEIVTFNKIPSKVNLKDRIEISIGTNLKESEKIIILNTLDYYDGNRRKTANCLGISERNLQYKIKEYNN